jgi:hypothetical protein
MAHESPPELPPRQFEVGHDRLGKSFPGEVAKYRGRKCDLQLRMVRCHPFDSDVYCFPVPSELTPCRSSLPPSAPMKATRKTPVGTL